MLVLDENLIIPQPKCEEIDGINFDDVTWTEMDGTNYPNFPENGVVKMCDENGNVTMEMLFIEGEVLEIDIGKTGNEVKILH